MVKYSDVQLDDIFSALGNQTRRQIVIRLAQGTATVTELAEPFHMSLPAVSKHLRVLEKSGLVLRTKRGREYQMTLNRAALDEARQWLEYYRRYWNDQLDSLQHYIEQQHIHDNGEAP